MTTDSATAGPAATGASPAGAVPGPFPPRRDRRPSRRRPWGRPRRRPGWVERDAEAVWAAQTAAIRDCLAGAVGPPAGTAISNQRESVVAARELLA